MSIDKEQQGTIEAGAHKDRDVFGIAVNAGITMTRKTVDLTVVTPANFVRGVATGIGGRLGAVAGLVADKEHFSDKNIFIDD